VCRVGGSPFWRLDKMAPAMAPFYQLKDSAVSVIKLPIFPDRMDSGGVVAIIASLSLLFIAVISVFSPSWQPHPRLVSAQGGEIHTFMKAISGRGIGSSQGDAAARQRLLLRSPYDESSGYDLKRLENLPHARQVPARYVEQVVDVVEEHLVGVLLVAHSGDLVEADQGVAVDAVEVAVEFLLQGL